MNGRILLEQPCRILTAVSAGADSVALLHALVRLAKAGQIDAEIRVAHVNHNLRGEASMGDQHFVEQLAQKLGLEIETASVEVRSYSKSRKLSLETSARQLRMNALMGIAQALQCDVVATGHHKDDNAETVIHRMLRGTGFRGLAGIHPRKHMDGRIDFIRPLLCMTRDEIAGYCTERGLSWRHDSSNDQTCFTRNRIRHLLLPELQKSCSISLPDRLSQLAFSSQAFVAHIEKAARLSWDKALSCQEQGRVVFLIDRLLEVEAPVRVELIRMALVSLGCGEGRLTSGHYQRVLGMLNSSHSHKQQLPYPYQSAREHDKLVLSRAHGPKETMPVESGDVLIKIPGITQFSQWDIEARVHNAGQCDMPEFIKHKNEYTEWFDLGKIKSPIAIRQRKDGDRFLPLGMSESKKVGKFLSACRVNAQRRQEVVVIEDRDGIIWLAPIRIAHHVRISNDSTEILEMTIRKSPDR